MRSLSGSASLRMSQILRMIVFVAAVGAIGCGDQDQGSPHGAGEQPRVSPATTSSFALLRGPGTTLPKGMWFHLVQILHGGDHTKFRPTYVQRAHTAGGVAWVFVDDRSVCLAEGHRGSVACTNARRARSEGVTLGTFTPPSARVPRPHDFSVIGLVPDRVQQVVVTVGKRRLTLAVRRNLFSVSRNSPILIDEFVPLRGRVR